MERLRNHFLRRHLLGWLLVPAALGLFVLAGCSDDDDDDNNTPPATSTSMSGSLGGPVNENGTLAITIQSGTLAGALRYQAASTGLVRPAGAVVVAAAGTIDLEGLGGQTAVSGTYNTDSDSLFLSGGGYTLVGMRTNTGAGQVIEGTYTGPNGNGAFFVLAGAGVPLQAYCGTYRSGADADSGYFDLTVRGSSLAGFSVSYLDPGNIVRLYGTATGSGNARDLEIQDPNDPGGAPLATGTWDTTTDTMSGTYGFGGDTGTWQTSLCD
jgi:hypothetical protein